MRGAELAPLRGSPDVRCSRRAPARLTEERMAQVSAFIHRERGKPEGSHLSLGVSRRRWSAGGFDA